jgi:hypothetical protein
MRWITKSHLHLDRVATPWLIARFVDPNAEFVFTAWNAPAIEDDGTRWFGVPGVELSSHDAGGTCFAKVMRAYRLDDPALVRMERVIASGVADALGASPPPGQTEQEATLGVALNQLGSGLAVAFDDERHLKAGLALYEALYTLCQVQGLRPEVRDDAPAALPDRVEYLRRAVGRGTDEVLAAPTTEEHRP